VRVLEQIEWLRGGREALEEFVRVLGDCVGILGGSLALRDVVGTWGSYLPFYCTLCGLEGC
jgi:hypothetical protein